MATTIHNVTSPVGHGYKDQKYAKGNLSPITPIVPASHTLAVAPMHEKEILPMPAHGLGPMHAPDINPDYNTPSMNFSGKQE